MKKERDIKDVKRRNRRRFRRYLRSKNLISKKVRKLRYKKMYSLILHNNF